MFKKILSAMLCIVITVNLVTANVFAMEKTWENTPENEEIIKALQLIEPIKENYGLTDADLENMKVGEPIKTYEYTNDGISFLRNYIPLICDGTLTAWAMEDTNSDKIRYQVSTAFVDKINATINKATSFALIYDRNNCYFFDGKVLQNLANYENIDSRLILTEDKLNNLPVELNSLYTLQDLEYEHGAVTYGAVLPVTSYRCKVSHVSQLNYSNPNLCWAASIACIVNYVKGTNYTAWDIYKDNEYTLGIDLTEGLPQNKEELVLEKYGLSYQCKFSVPEISVFQRNIKSDYPIYGFFNYYDKGFKYHVGTIYGCASDNNNSESSCIYIMDPLALSGSKDGFITAYYDFVRYEYISPYNGFEYRLESITSRF